MIPHSQSQEKVLNELNVDSTIGLSSAQVAERREKFGENKLKGKKKKTNLERFFEQFKDAMIMRGSTLIAERFHPTAFFVFCFSVPEAVSPFAEIYPPYSQGADSL